MTNERKQQIDAAIFARQNGEPVEFHSVSDAVAAERAARVTPDFRIANHGTVWVFTAISGEAKTFVNDRLELEAWQYLGEGFAVDHRPARALAEGLANEGFSCVEG